MKITPKVWIGDIVYQEPVCFSTDATGHLIGGHLLYSPNEILQVSSFDGQIVYKAGIDYKMDLQGISRTEKSAIPFLAREEYCKPFAGQENTAWVRLPGGQQYIEVLSEIYRYQVLVTYRHKGIWKGFKPESQIPRLKRTAECLASSTLNLMFYGDSITAGWEASGADELAIDMVNLTQYHVSIHHPPYMPAWAHLVTEELKTHFPNCHICKTNRAAGGSTTDWGVKNAERLVNPCAPDLVVLGFGMNSMHDSPEKYETEIRQIISIVRKDYPECEFLLVSPMIPNPEIAGFQNNQLLHHEERLESICNSTYGIGLAPVHSLFLQVAEYGKHYLELSGNCINHPNDFSIRMYAQCVLTALGM